MSHRYLKRQLNVHLTPEEFNYLRLESAKLKMPQNTFMRMRLFNKTKEEIEEIDNAISNDTSSTIGNVKQSTKAG